MKNWTANLWVVTYNCIINLLQSSLDILNIKKWVWLLLYETEMFTHLILNCFQQWTKVVLSLLNYQIVQQFTNVQNHMKVSELHSDMKEIVNWNGSSFNSKTCLICSDQKLFSHFETKKLCCSLQMFRIIYESHWIGF